MVGDVGDEGTRRDMGAPEFEDMASAWTACVAADPDKTLIRYLGAGITVREIEAWSSALASELTEMGVTKGDRVLLVLQNVSAFAIAVLAAWKVRPTVVPVNPMLTSKEMSFIGEDSEAVAAIAHHGLAERLYDLLDVRPTTQVVLTGEADLGGRGLPEPFEETMSAQTIRGQRTTLLNIIKEQAGDSPPKVALAPDDHALIMYTSGTTGSPKGAVLTHANVAFNTESCLRWIGLQSDDVILAIAPLFHITGFILHLCMSLRGFLTLVLTYRFHAENMLETTAEERPTFTIGAISAFVALGATVQSDPAGRQKFVSLTKVYSGGAPIRAATLEWLRNVTGVYIRNMYGLTETTSAVIGVPRDEYAPVDGPSGAVAIGRPMFSTAVRIIDDDGAVLVAGQLGELVVSGPQVMAGYWRNPDATRNTLRAAAMWTGDVGFVDSAGWVYVVDRKKDVIISSGYKVWPGEVEDVISRHQAVREVAVAGLPDDYRGELVTAFVTLVDDSHLVEDELIAFCRERLALYKAPRRVVVVDELPKTATGKMLRRALRSGGPRSHG